MEIIPRDLYTKLSIPDRRLDEEVKCMVITYFSHLCAREYEDKEMKHN